MRNEQTVRSTGTCWYISYRLSYRDLVAMTGERGLEMAHTTPKEFPLKSNGDYLLEKIDAMSQPFAADKADKDAERK